MRNVRRGTATSIAALLAGCSLFVDTSDLTSTSKVASVDASVDAAPSDAQVADAPADTAPADPCIMHVGGTTLPPLVPLDARWALRGIAKVDDVGAVLATGQTFSAGAMWWSETLDLDRFDLTTVLRLRAVEAVSADGLAIAWIRGAVPGAPTQDGSSLGVQGLPGYGAALDVLGGTVNVLDLTKSTSEWALFTKPLPNLLDDKDHVVRIRNNGGTVAVSIDGAIIVDAFAIPGYQPVRGTYGLSAATGGGVYVQHVTRTSFRTELCP